MPRNTDDFVATVLPRRVTFGEWLQHPDGTMEATCFINNHFRGRVFRSVEGVGGHSFTVLANHIFECDNIVQLAALL